MPLRASPHSRQMLFGCDIAEIRYDLIEMQVL
jgi:hypothetical protein